MFLVGLAALSLTWTPFPEGPAERFWKNTGTLALVAIAAGFLPKRTRICDLNLLPIGVAAAAILLGGAASINIFMHKPLTVEEIIDGNALARSGVGLALIMWPAAGALALRGRWYSAGALTLVSMAACLLSGAPERGARSPRRRRDLRDLVRALPARRRNGSARPPPSSSCSRLSSLC